MLFIDSASILNEAPEDEELVEGDEDVEEPEDDTVEDEEDTGTEEETVEGEGDTIPAGAPSEFSGSDTDKKVRLFTEYEGLLSLVENFIFKLNNQEFNVVKIDYVYIMEKLSSIKDTVSTILIDKFPKMDYSELLYYFVVLKTEVVTLSDIVSKGKSDEKSS